MKRVIAWDIMGIALVVVLIIFIIYRNSQRKIVTLFVNGNAIEDMQVEIKNSHAIFSLVDVLKVFGYSQESYGDDIILLKGDRSLILSLSDETLAIEGKEDNLLLFPPGTQNGYRKFQNDDVYVNEELLREILLKLGKKVSIEVYKNRAVIEAF